MLRNLILFAFVLLLAACGGNAPTTTTAEVDEAAHQAEEALYEGAMAAHDEAMPKMGELMNLKRQLEEAENVPAELQAAVAKATQSLENAHEGMMEGMRGFKDLETMREEMPHEEIIKYWENQKIVMEAVQDSISTSIAQATALLNQLSGQ